MKKIIILLLLNVLIPLSGIANSNPEENLNFENILSDLISFEEIQEITSDVDLEKIMTKFKKYLIDGSNAPQAHVCYQKLYQQYVYIHKAKRLKNTQTISREEEISRRDLNAFFKRIKIEKKIKKLDEIEKLVYSEERFILAMLPFASDAADFAEVITGISFVTNKKLSNIGRALSAVGLIAGSGEQFRTVKHLLFALTLGKNTVSKIATLLRIKGINENPVGFVISSKAYKQLMREGKRLNTLFSSYVTKQERYALTALNDLNNKKLNEIRIKILSQNISPMDKELTLFIVENKHFVQSEMIYTNTGETSLMTNESVKYVEKGSFFVKLGQPYNIMLYDLNTGGCYIPEKPNIQFKKNDDLTITFFKKGHRQCDFVPSYVKRYKRVSSLFAVVTEWLMNKYAVLHDK